MPGGASDAIGVMAGMPCYHCGTRQVDPDRGASPWTRGVLHDHQILVCPACQASRDWTAELDRCDRCGSAHLVRRLDEVECRDCGLTRLAGASGPTAPDPELAAEVEQALARVLGRTTAGRRGGSQEAGAASGRTGHW